MDEIAARIDNVKTIARLEADLAECGFETFFGESCCAACRIAAVRRIASKHQRFASLARQTADGHGGCWLELFCGTHPGSKQSATEVATDLAYRQQPLKILLAALLTLAGMLFAMMPIIQPSLVDRHSIVTVVVAGFGVIVGLALLGTIEIDRRRR